MTSLTDKQIEAGEAEWLDLWKQGPTRLRWTKVPLQVGDLAPDFELKDTSGKLVHLRDFWSKGPALIYFGDITDAVVELIAQNFYRMNTRTTLNWVHLSL